MRPTEFTKPGCDCDGCTKWGEHQEGFQGFHYITLTHGPGTDTASCRCGWVHTDWPDKVGGEIWQHRLHAYRDVPSFQERQAQW